MLIKNHIATSIILLYISIGNMQIIEDMVEYVPYDSNINLTISFLEKEYSLKDVKGIQFDIFYNPNNLIYNEIVSLIKGSIFEYTLIKNGQIRCIMFNLDGRNITKMELSNLVNISFIQPNNFYDNTKVYIENVIIAGRYGKDISSNFTFNSFNINFNNLKPLYTYIYNPYYNVFEDSISISFQLYKDSNVNISLYDMFGIKIETIIDKYINLGIYNFIIDDYDQFEEKLPYGKYEIQFSANDEYRDSIYVIYQKSKNKN